MTKAARVSEWCREQDLNLHAFWALDPKSSASANSAIPACAYFKPTPRFPFFLPVLAATLILL